MRLSWSLSGSQLSAPDTQYSQAGASTLLATAFCARKQVQPGLPLWLQSERARAQQCSQPQLQQLAALCWCVKSYEFVEVWR